MMFDIILILVFVLVLAYFISQRQPAGSPPGPYGLPIIGNLLQVGEKPFLKFIEWKEKYGPIIMMNFGSFRTIAVSDYKLIRTVLQDPAFQGRPNMPSWQARSDDTCPRGIIFTEGQEHSEQRKFTSKHIRDVMTNRGVIDAVIKSEVHELTDALEKLQDEPISLKLRFHMYILNIIWYIVAGQDCEEDRAEITKILTNTSKTTEENSLYSSLCMFLPWVANYFPNISGFNEMNKELGTIWKFLGKHINRHKEQYEKQPGVFDDVIGAFIDKIHNTSDPASSFYKDVGERSLMTSILDLFFAGAETSSNTLHWACLYLATHPRVQEKLFEEIEQIVGKLRLPSFEDEVNMPFTQAVVQETLRMSSVAPMAVFHSATDNSTLEGYRIPKDTMILVNLHGAHYDKMYWGDPEVFRPERHLDSDGKTLIKHEALLAFGLGRRSCIGEVLARNEIFAFLTGIIQRFQISVDPANADPSLEPVVAFVLIPQDHKLVFTKRK